MTAPREVLPASTAMVTRRCTQRQFLLRPDEKTNAIFAYCLAEAAMRFDVGVIAWTVMSNHYHAVIYDRHGRAPAFAEHLHKMVAKVFNVRWEREENFWSSAETSITYLRTAEDIFRKVVYVLSNPVTADLVDRLADWPGSSSLQHPPGTQTTERRPSLYFRRNGTMPETVELQTMLPRVVLERESAESWHARVREALAEKEEAARQARLREGRGIMGRKEVLRASPFDSPKTKPPRGRLRPTLAAKDRELRIAELRRLAAFRLAYREARKRFLSGDRDAEFPVGTYRMRLLGARCAEPIPIAA